MRAPAALIAILAAAAALSAQKPEPTLEEVLVRAGAYIASYGEKAAVVVATERYTQSVSLSPRPIVLEAEFAIVRAAGAWTGYRDIVEVDGKPVQDRRDRLVSLLTDTSGDAGELTRITNENARFNLGTVTRNFNVPTVAMFFFTPKDQPRFTFKRKGTRKIDGVPAWEIEYKETQRPTLIRTRAGRDVPIEGVLWVRPDDGVVVRTRMKLRNFVNTERPPEQGAPSMRPPENPNVPRGAAGATASLPDMTPQQMESEATIDVTYRKPSNIDVWFPASMDEFYSGPIIVRNSPMMATTTSRAQYSNFRQFGTSIKIVP